MFLRIGNMVMVEHVLSLTNLVLSECVLDKTVHRNEY
jgi:hypothetical protein